MMEIVKIAVEDVDDIFNKFDSNDITDELATYIENRCSRVRRQEMQINIITKDKLDDKIKDRIVTAIRSHFGLETKYCIDDIKKRKLINVSLFLLGIFILLFKNLLPLLNTITDIADILAWFIMWESAYNLLFRDSAFDIKIDRAKKISNCQIKFKVK